MTNLITQFEDHYKDPSPVFYECEEDEHLTSLDEEEPVFNDAMYEVTHMQDGTLRGYKGSHTYKNLEMMTSTMYMTMTSVTACDVTSLNNEEVDPFTRNYTSLMQKTCPYHQTQGK